MEKGRVILFMGMKGGEISVNNEIEKFVSSEWKKKRKKSQSENFNFYLSSN